MKLNLNLAHIYLHIMMSGKKLVMHGAIQPAHIQRVAVQYAICRRPNACQVAWCVWVVLGGGGGRTGDKRRVPPGQKLSVDFPLGEK